MPLEGMALFSEYWYNTDTHQKTFGLQIPPSLKRTTPSINIEHWYPHFSNQHLTDSLTHIHPQPHSLLTIIVTSFILGSRNGDKIEKSPQHTKKEKKQTSQGWKPPVSKLKVTRGMMGLPTDNLVEIEKTAQDARKWIKNLLMIEWAKPSSLYKSWSTVKELLKRDLIMFPSSVFPVERT